MLINVFFATFIQDLKGNNVAINVNQLRAGAKVMLDGHPCVVVDNEHVKPGKGPAFNRLKVRYLANSRIVSKTFPSNADIEEADVVETTMQLLYVDHEGWHFMDQTTYEQCTLTKNEVGDARYWLKDGVTAVVILWKDKPLSLTVDIFVELEVTECSPNVKGDTVTAGTKVAIVETGYEVRVPLFIEVGDIVKIDTRTGEYVSRRKA